MGAAERTREPSALARARSVPDVPSASRNISSAADSSAVAPAAARRWPFAVRPGWSPTAASTARCSRCTDSVSARFPAARTASGTERVASRTSPRTAPATSPSFFAALPTASARRITREPASRSAAASPLGARVQPTAINGRGPARLLAGGAALRPVRSALVRTGTIEMPRDRRLDVVQNPFPLRRTGGLRIVDPLAHGVADPVANTPRTRRRALRRRTGLRGLIGPVIAVEVARHGSLRGGDRIGRRTIATTTRTVGADGGQGPACLLPHRPRRRLRLRLRIRRALLRLRRRPGGLLGRHGPNRVLPRVLLRDALLRDALLRDALLRDALLRDALLRRARLRGLLRRRARLRPALLRGIPLSRRLRSRARPRRMRLGTRRLLVARNLRHRRPLVRLVVRRLRPRPGRVVVARRALLRLRRVPVLRVLLRRVVVRRRLRPRGTRIARGPRLARVLFGVLRRLLAGRLLRRLRVVRVRVVVA